MYETLTAYGVQLQFMAQNNLEFPLYRVHNPQLNFNTENANISWYVQGPIDYPFQWHLWDRKFVVEARFDDTITNIGARAGHYTLTTIPE